MPALHKTNLMPLFLNKRKPKEQTFARHIFNGYTIGHLLDRLRGLGFGEGRRVGGGGVQLI